MYGIPELNSKGEAISVYESKGMIGGLRHDGQLEWQTFHNHWHNLKRLFCVSNPHLDQVLTPKGY